MHMHENSDTVIVVGYFNVAVPMWKIDLPSRSPQCYWLGWFDKACVLKCLGSATGTGCRYSEDCVPRCPHSWWIQIPEHSFTAFLVRFSCNVSRVNLIFVLTWCESRFLGVPNVTARNFEYVACDELQIHALLRPELRGELAQHWCAQSTVCTGHVTEVSTILTEYTECVLTCLGHENCSDN